MPPSTNAQTTATCLERRIDRCTTAPFRACCDQHQCPLRRGRMQGPHVLSRARRAVRPGLRGRHNVATHSSGMGEGRHEVESQPGGGPGGHIRRGIDGACGRTGRAARLARPGRLGHQQLGTPFAAASDGAATVIVGARETGSGLGARTWSSPDGLSGWTAVAALSAEATGLPTVTLDSARSRVEAGSHQDGLRPRRGAAPPVRLGRGE